MGFHICFEAAKLMQFTQSYLVRTSPALKSQLTLDVISYEMEKRRLEMELYHDIDFVQSFNFLTHSSLL